MLCKSKCGEENKGDATRKQTSHNKQTDSESQIERKKKNRLIERYNSQYPSQQLSAQRSPALLFYPLPGAQMPESVSPTSLPANFSLDASGITATLSDASACEINCKNPITSHQYWNFQRLVKWANCDSQAVVMTASENYMYMVGNTGINR